MGICWPHGATTVAAITTEPLSLSLLFALPALLPALRTLELWDFALGRGILGPPPCPQPYSTPFTLQKLTLMTMKSTFDNTAVLAAVSAFAHIDTLVLRCGCSAALAPAPADCPRRFARTAVRRLEARYPAGLAHLTDQLAPDTLHHLKLAEYSAGSAEALLRGAPALISLAYCVADAPPPPPPAAHLAALEISCPVSIESAPDVEPYVEAPAWPVLQAHLAALAVPRLRALTVALLPCSPIWEGAPPEGALARVLAECLWAQNWAGFAGLRGRCPELRTVRVAVVQDWGWLPGGCTAVPEELLGCVGRVVREVAEERLGDVRDILEVVVEERVGERVVLHDLDSLE
ncbi:hypothetical protein PsYK624_129620 [Phanerochaete sordida]|uniref:Uncharacterized protein n=1 Tax=Phanerochaete sordida TaxID=48140 RepID=A0A9P3GKP7_9APHY|nr:hypothetical protein PsYK624_129620 [Phanerochaete sordida]